MALKIFFRLKVEGQRNIPPEGGVILASNHCSLLDPPLVGVSSGRPLYFLAKKELFDPPGFGRLIAALHAFPVSRGFGRKAIEQVLKMLKTERMVLLFPEGTRQKDGTLGHARAGVGMIALKSGKPIVPVWVSGSHRAWRAFIGLRRVRVRFGRPIQPEAFRASEDRKQRYQCIGDQVMEAIGKMAGQNDR
ncbi:MAG: 1-acyl-sn-glycerol-3-phosphate acyltransferase [Candidatus Latescibacteria bacterium]|nr:1-acyl-sn-glycerol-3-phosphate acyltransferase [Candidatus Latescibacterota bacterium]